MCVCDNNNDFVNFVCYCANLNEFFTKKTLWIINVSYIAFIIIKGNKFKSINKCQMVNLIKFHITINNILLLK